MLAEIGAAAAGIVCGWLAGSLTGAVVARAAGPGSIAGTAWLLAGPRAALAAAVAGAGAFAFRARVLPQALGGRP